MIKKTKQIAIRITPETYYALKTMSQMRKWSLAFSANEILEEYFRNIKRYEDDILVKTDLRTDACGN